MHAPLFCNKRTMNQAEYRTLLYMVLGQYQGLKGVKEPLLRRGQTTQFVFRDEGHMRQWLANQDEGDTLEQLLWSQAEDTSAQYPESAMAALLVLINDPDAPRGFRLQVKYQQVCVAEGEQQQ